MNVSFPNRRRLRNGNTPRNIRILFFILIAGLAYSYFKSLYGLYQRANNAPQSTANNSPQAKANNSPHDRKGRKKSPNQSTQEKSIPSKQNILILYADDWRHDTLGLASENLILTPNLDQLAKEGVRFTHNCVTTAICDVSRISFLTGMWMSRHQMGHKESCKDFYTPWSSTYPGVLRSNGYYVGHVGKWDLASQYHGRYDYGVEYQDWHLKCDNNTKHDTACLDFDGPVDHITAKNERDAMKFFDTRPKDKPFALTVAFFATHAVDGAQSHQYYPQKESHSLYENVEIPLAPTANEESWTKMPPFFSEENFGRDRWHWRFDTPEKHQVMMRNYFRLASEVDSTSGRILDRLRSEGILDDTLVIFTTDNGYFHGEHGLADKWYPHEESIRVPLIIKDPRMPKDKIGTSNDDFTLNVDLAPTILSFAGIKPPVVMQGQDISRLYLKRNPTWRKDFFYEHPSIRDGKIPSSKALVRKDFKYFHWPDYDVEQLFNLKDDPYEDNDLITSKEHKHLVKEMKKKLAWWETHVKTGIPTLEERNTFIAADRQAFKAPFS